MRYGVNIFRQTRGSPSTRVRDPGLAGFLNILFPGLGCAYLGRWFYAIAYLIWVPLALAAASVLSGLAAHIVGLYLPGTVVNILTRGISLFLLRAIVLWDVFFTPYRFAQEYNQTQNGGIG
jgi:hypothetical protein